jgi:hypothetical protein
MRNQCYGRFSALSLLDYVTFSPVIITMLLLLFTITLYSPLPDKQSQMFITHGVQMLPESVYCLLRRVARMTTHNDI